MKGLIKKFLAVVLVFSMLHFSCPRPALAFSLGEEREVGEILLYQIRQAFPLLDDPDLSQYVNDLGDKVLAVAGVQYFDYHLFVVKSKEFNAFAAPSGLIFFYTGLIETMDSEDELLSVLAHEIGHVVSRHIAARMDKGMKVGLATLALALAGLALGAGGAGAAGQAVVTGSMAAGQAMNLHFSRQDEEEADLLSYGWMKKMGRDTAAMEKMLKTMRRITRYRMGQIPQYLLTHPDPEARMGYVQSLMAVDKAAKASEVIGVTEVKNPKKADDFAFLRFKYRVMAQIEDDGQFRNFITSRSTDSQLSPFERSMAKYGLSQVEREANNLERSRALLQEVIAAFPDRSILLVDLGRIELAAGNKDKARELIEKAARQDPADLWAVFQLAKVHQALGNSKEAEGNYFTIARETPEYAKVYYELGKIRSDQGQKSEASYYLGKYYLYEGRIELAKDKLERVVKERSLSVSLHQDARAMLETIERLEEGPGSKKEQEEEKRRKEEEERRDRRRPPF